MTAVDDGRDRNGLPYDFPRVLGMPLCSDVTAFWRGPSETFKPAISAFYEAAVDALDSSLKWYQTETMGQMRPVTDEALAMLPFWLADPRARRQIATLDLEGAEDADFPSDHAFSLKLFDTSELKTGACRLVLPATFALEKPDAFRALARRLLACGNFNYASAGLAVNWSPLRRSAGAARGSFRYTAARFMGVDIPDLTGSLLALPDGIKCANWITFLGSELWERLSLSIEDLQRREEIMAEDCDHGVLVTAGPRPLLGDTYRGERMDAYQAVGAQLAAIRTRAHPPILPSGPNEDDEDATERWLSRFDTEAR